MTDKWGGQSHPVDPAVRAAVESTFPHLQLLLAYPIHDSAPVIRGVLARMCVTPGRQSPPRVDLDLLEECEQALGLAMLKSLDEHDD